MRRGAAGAREAPRADPAREDQRDEAAYGEEAAVVVVARAVGRLEDRFVRHGGERRGRRRATQGAHEFDQVSARRLEPSWGGSVLTQTNKAGLGGCAR